MTLIPGPAGPPSAAATPRLARHVTEAGGSRRDTPGSGRLRGVAPPGRRPRCGARRRGGPAGPGPGPGARGQAPGPRPARAAPRRPPNEESPPRTAAEPRVLPSAARAPFTSPLQVLKGCSEAPPSSSRLNGPSPLRLPPRPRCCSPCSILVASPGAARPCRAQDAALPVGPEQGRAGGHASCAVPAGPQQHPFFPRPLSDRSGPRQLPRAACRAVPQETGRDRTGR